MKKKYTDISIFCGPSIDKNLFQKNTFTFFPPIQRGDIYKLLKKKPKAIGIVDGFFGSKPAITHKEIIEAINSGICVYGSSSMGALRAAELDIVGMLGVGIIYEMYKTNKVNGDDEVAILHLPEEFSFQNITFPLVELRLTLSKSVALSLINENESIHILETASKLPYTNRKLEPIILKTFNDNKKQKKIIEILKLNWVHQKREDALSLLNILSKPDYFFTNNHSNNRSNLIFTSWERHHKMNYERNFHNSVSDLQVLQITKLLCKNFYIFQNTIIYGVTVLQLYFKSEYDEDYITKNSYKELLCDFDDVLFNYPNSSKRFKEKLSQFEISQPLDSIEEFKKSGTKISRFPLFRTVVGTRPDKLVLLMLKQESIILKTKKIIKEIFFATQVIKRDFNVEYTLINNKKLREIYLKDMDFNLISFKNLILERGFFLEDDFIEALKLIYPFILLKKINFKIFFTKYSFYFEEGKIV